MTSQQLASPVLLVCIYNQFGTIITHDYLHEMFKPFGEILKILIFEKTKVWKSFVEYSDPSSAALALATLNNHPVFNDGSKMNIFRSKRGHIHFQNQNLGGVNYEGLQTQDAELLSHTAPQDNRKRRSTYQDHTSEQEYYFQDHKLEKYYFEDHKQQKYPFEEHKQTDVKESTLSSNHIEEQFKQIAMEDQDYFQWKNTWNQTSNKSSAHNKSEEHFNQGQIQKCHYLEDKEQYRCQKNRRKSKTIFNPLSQQFLLQNRPSKVLFIRSLPPYYNNRCIYNIFSSFGVVSKVIFIKSKDCALAQFQEQSKAIQAKDELNYAKAQFKVFYSHYQTLVLRQGTQDQDVFEYREGQKHNNLNLNPPTEVLYLTKGHPQCQDEVRAACDSIGCKIIDMEWKQSQKAGWMCLLQFQTLSNSLLALGQLQGMQLSNGKQIRLSFTRSKIQK